MRLGWKLMIPSTLVWVVVVAFIRGSNAGFLGTTRIDLFGRQIYRSTLIVIAVTALLVLAAAWIWDTRSARRQEAADARSRVPEEIDPFAGGHPVPPLPGQRLVEPLPALSAAAARPGTTRDTDDILAKEPRG